jgi:DNA-binding NarL/FixJ family response regulator
MSRSRNKVPQLSRHQKRILGMLNEGMGRRAIARELGISVETVRSRIEDIKLRLQVPVGENIEATLRIARDKGVLD